MIKMDKQFLLHFETGPQGMGSHVLGGGTGLEEGQGSTATDGGSLRVTLILCMMMELEGRLVLVHEAPRTI